MVRKSLQRRKRVQRRTPGGRLVTHFRRETYGKAQCGICGKSLNAVKGGSPHKIKRSKKGDRRPNRPFGGVLCSKCSIKVLSLKAKYRLGFIKEGDVPISLKKYVIGG